MIKLLEKDPMLKSLEIKDFALIESLMLEFSPNLNILTGETGAGKSVIVDALMLALGDRGSADVVRKTSKKATIECIFSFPVSHRIFKELEDNDYDIFDNEVILRREISAKGISRCFLNDTPIPVSKLKEYGDTLVDFHGQHDHQILLNTKSHIFILDNISGIEHHLNDHKRLFNELKDTINNYSELSAKGSELKRSAELMQFELDEINKISPEENEESKIENELKILENFELLLDLSNEVFSKLYESDSSAHEKISDAHKAIRQLAQIDDSFSVYAKECNAALIAIDEIAKYTRDYSSAIEFDPEKIEKMRERVSLLRGLRKKYGAYDQIFERKKFLEGQLSLVSNYDNDLNDITNEIIQKKHDLGNLANKISDLRKLHSEKFSASIIQKLNVLGIYKADFKVEITNTVLEDADIRDITAEINGKHYKLNQKGIDRIEFLISTNPGEPLKPLARIASGGEISRVMLAIKSIVADSENLPILVFDEIDTGISGRIAQIVGKEMRQLAVKHQILAITHLPQIAAMANRNIRVEKLERDGLSIIKGKTLSNEESLEEVAKLISGSEITHAALESARELQNS